MAVHLGHGQLVGEVGVTTQPLDDGLRARLAADVHQQSPGERLDAHVGQSCQCRVEERDPLVDAEGALLGGVVQHGDDHLVVQRRGSGDHVDMAHRHRVVGPRTHAPALLVRHAAEPSSELVACGQLRAAS